LVLIDTISQPSRNKADIIPGCTIFPNPSQGQTSITITGFTGNLSLKIYSSTGCFLYSQNLIVEAYDFKQDVDLSSVSAGVYYFVLEGFEFKKAFRVIKV